MNRKKKICIIIIIILTFIILGNIFLILTNKDIEVANNEEIKLQEENTTSENMTSNVVDENVITQNEISENTTIDETQENISVSSINDTKKVTTQDNQKNTQNEIQNNKSQAPVVAQKETTTQTQVETNIKTEEPQKTDTKVETAPAVTETNVEKYVRNDAMINRIKQVIQNNETADMKNFGYSIVVDSSIKNRTNQFTFTESRVINAIRLKFGTIRIYAEDYYYNGQLIMTECYIL